MGFEIQVSDDVPADLADGPDVHNEDTGVSPGTEDSLETEESENEDIGMDGKPLGSDGDDIRSGTRRESSPTGDGGSRYNEGDSNDGRLGPKNTAGTWKVVSQSFYAASVASILSLLYVFVASR